MERDRHQKMSLAGCEPEPAAEKSKIFTVVEFDNSFLILGGAFQVCSESSSLHGSVVIGAFPPAGSAHPASRAVVEHGAAEVPAHVVAHERSVVEA